ncbi:hypothetical protein EV368DRAFT_82519 [Lentinula lateritia]|nr:hypothetical protein EV368DRAFT_82519 [Lentinula lateritia]
MQTLGVTSGHSTKASQIVPVNYKSTKDTDAYMYSGNDADISESLHYGCLGQMNQVASALQTPISILAENVIIYKECIWLREMLEKIDDRGQKYLPSLSTSVPSERKLPTAVQLDNDMSSPSLQTWKAWLKQVIMKDNLIVSALPTLLKIGAILPAQGTSPSLTPVKICDNPLIVSTSKSANLMPHSEGSTVLCHRPLRAYHSNGANDVVPKCTSHSDEVLRQYSREGSRAHVQRKNPSTLIGSYRMCSSGGALRISNASHMLRHSPTHLLLGTLAGLKGACVFDSFYWIPSVENFPGIDGVLGDATGNLFALQVTIAG